MPKKKSFFERLTGSVRVDDEFEDESDFYPVEKKSEPVRATAPVGAKAEKDNKWMEEEEEEGQLSVDLYQTPTDIYVETMVAGVRPEDLQITITRDMITLRGKREQARTVNDEDFFTRELYWGTFARTISLPAEVEAEEAEAIERHGLLVIRLPKMNKDKQTHLKVKSV
jgi:HSP20 family protein